MKYIAKKSIPLFKTPIKNGDIVDSDNQEYSSINFLDTSFFQLFKETPYNKNDKVLVKSGVLHKKVELCIVVKVDQLKGLYEVRTINNNVINVVKERDIIGVPTYFYFINSNGRICNEYEERSGIDKDGLLFKKKSGNYFLDIDSARSHRALILNN